MKRTLYLSLCALASIFFSDATALADQPAPTPASAPPSAPAIGATDGPRIKFDSEAFDGGKAPAGQPLNHTFIFTNIGNQTLEVTKVNPTCGCTVAGTWTKTVEPGKSGTIPLTVNVNQQWSGDMTKTITVESNDKSKPNTPLTIKFSVWKPIEISQQYVFLNIPAESTNEVSTIIRVKNNTEEPLAIYEPHSSTPAMAVEIKTNTAGKEYELKVRAVQPYKEGNNVGGTITTKTSATNMPVLSINGSVNVQRAILVNPPQIVLEAPPFTNVIQKPVTIQYTGSKSLHLSNPVFSAKGVAVQVNESQPGRVFTVTLSFPPGFESSGRPMELTLDSDSAQMPVIKVPVNQLPRAIQPSVPSVPGAKPAAGLTPAVQALKQ